jgi:hydrogenase expression/formation protein HypD
LFIRNAFRNYDASARFDLPVESASESPDCIAGAVLQGLRVPMDCPMFSTGCTPEHPLGAPMVSSEGACAAYYRYGGKKRS